ncbi:MAG TPA: aminopeptidase, partial [Elusimicrobiales bacterium]|nr:aminopeptidase [Elusimicrobiales bacterium]
MLTPNKLEKYAEILLWGLKTARKGKIARYETVMVRYDLPARPLAEVVQKKLLQHRQNVVIRANLTPGMEKAFFSEADKKQLGFLWPGEKELYSCLNGYIFLRAPESLTHLRGAAPAKIAAAISANKVIWDIRNSREDRGLFSWTLCSCPTEELARQAHMSLPEYAAQVEKACF